MKWSIYNELITHNGHVFLYNCFTEKVIAMDPALREVLSRQDLKIIATIHPQLHKTLIHENFIIEDNYDECNACYEKLKKQLASTNSIKLTINPTMDCNLRCWYCYEKHENGSKMDDHTIEKINRYISKTMILPTLKKFHISFFGGEPLLQYDKVIKTISGNFDTLCQNLEIKGLISITTNGILLTNDIICDLKHFSTSKSIQVPFDGGREFYNKIKKISGINSCYDIVIKNVISAIENNFLVNIRCNYTAENLHSFKYLIEDLQNYKGYQNLRVSFHKVWQAETNDKQTEELLYLKDMLSDFRINSNLAHWSNTNRCYADYDNNYVINYNGDIFKCTARNFNHENRLGYISNNGDLTFNEKMQIRENGKITNQCRECRLLPICKICSQHRFESGKCPGNDAEKENASYNIKQHFIQLFKSAYE